MSQGPKQPHGASRLPEDEPILTPEQHVGATIELEGVPYRIDSILATGGTMVVFSLTNLHTGKSDQVLKILREHFDPRPRLAEALTDALQAVQDDPDRVVKICDMLLALDPSSEVAAFDKGVALMVKGEGERALDAFDLAIAISPADLWNWLQKTSCLAMLGRDGDTLYSFLVATNLDAIGTRECLAQAPGLAKEISGALKRLASQNSSDTAAQRALEEYFR